MIDGAVPTDFFLTWLLSIAVTTITFNGRLSTFDCWRYTTVYCLSFYAINDPFIAQLAHDPTVWRAVLNDFRGSTDPYDAFYRQSDGRALNRCEIFSMTSPEILLSEIDVLAPCTCSLLFSSDELNIVVHICSRASRVGSFPFSTNVFPFS